MISYKFFYGLITTIDEFWTNNPQNEGCYKIMTIQMYDGNIINFIISPDTYFVDNYVMKIGDLVVGYYDANAPVPLIYPPQYRALIVAQLTLDRNIKVDFFNEQLISSDGMLKLNIFPSTKIIQENGQIFTGNLANRNLIVTYGPVTRSIPAQTTPYKVIVICRM